MYFLHRFVKDACRKVYLILDTGGDSREQHLLVVVVAKFQPVVAAIAEHVQLCHPGWLQ